jgi:hypothetical protein
VSAFTISAGYHYDPIFRGLQISGATNAISCTTAGQVVRLVVEDVLFISCAVALLFNSAGGVVGFALRRCTFSSCTGDNIKATNGQQAGPGVLDTCWFQGSGASITSYINLPQAGGVSLDSWTYIWCVFEGPHPNATHIPVLLGGVSHHVFIGCMWADFSLTGTQLPLIQTLGQANGCPVRLSFINCNMTNANGAIINVQNPGGGVTAGWTFLGSLLSPKAGVSPLTLSANLYGIVFENCSLTVAQTWSASAGLYIYSYEAGLSIPFKQVGVTQAGASGLTTDGLVTTGVSATGGAGLNVPHGVAPTTPNNGDIWTATTGLFARINAATKTLANLQDAQAFAGLSTFNAGATLGAGSNLTTDSGTATGAAGAVTLNKQSGTITTEALTTAGGAAQLYTVTNSVCTATARVFVNVKMGSGTTNTTAPVYATNAIAGAGSFTVDLRNGALATPLNGTLKFDFWVVL